MESQKVTVWCGFLFGIIETFKFETDHTTVFLLQDVDPDELQ